jgi:hypothetical protein
MLHHALLTDLCSSLAGMSCNGCVGKGECGYSLSYTEGSSIRGHMVEDTVVFASTKVQCSLAAISWQLVAYSL